MRYMMFYIINNDSCEIPCLMNINAAAYGMNDVFFKIIFGYFFQMPFPLFYFQFKG